MDDLKKVLNQEQLSAVDHGKGPALVLAGAGSGKTRVIIHRIAHLVGELGIHPEQILAVTFTNKAATEMRNRAALMLGRSLRDLRMGTFHGLGAQILREEAPFFGRDKGFTIYDSDDSKKLVKECLKDMTVDPKRIPARAVLVRIEAAKHEVLNPADVEPVPGWDLGELVPRVYRYYEALIKRANAVDFGDLIRYPVMLLDADNEVRARWSGRFKYVLVDEYQDLNVAQYRMLQLLSGSGENLFVVGDPDQSIYGWRGADVRNILEFQKDFPGSTIYRLENNYRSYGNILKVADSVIHKNRKRLEKTLRAVRELGPKVTLLEAYSDREEAEEVASMAKQAWLGPSKGKSGEVAVLYRTNAQSRLMEEALRRLEVPYEIVGGTRFYERKEIKDALAYLTLTVNPRDDLALRRVANFPPRGLGMTTLNRLWEKAKKQELPMIDILREAAEKGQGMSARARKAAGEFLRLVLRMDHFGKSGGTQAALMFLLETGGYLEYLNAEGTEEAASRAENLQELVSGAAELAETTGDASVSAFLEHVSLVAGVDRLSGDVGVILMTLHTAKGLEFDSVFITGLEEGLLPHSNSIEDPWDLEEERRLFYVGVTRGKNRVVLSRAMTRRLYGAHRSNPPSRFLSEIPQDLLAVAGHESKDSDEESHGEEPKAKYNPGDRVLHHRFGEGVIVEASPTKGDIRLEVSFEDSGRKTLLASFARLKKI